MTGSSECLNYAINAVSLAYLWHESYSEYSLNQARQYYGMTLKLLKNALQSSAPTQTASTVLTTLLLDLFEKITCSSSRKHVSWTCHLEGALKLLACREPGQDQSPIDSHVLSLLSKHYMAGCIACGCLIPSDLVAIRARFAPNPDNNHDTMSMYPLMVEYVTLKQEFDNGIYAAREIVQRFHDLDVSVEALEEAMPLSWQSTTMYRTITGSCHRGRRIDTYTHRNICSARNMLRIIRLELNQVVIEHAQHEAEEGTCRGILEASIAKIECLVDDICASLPSWTDCDHDLSPSIFAKGHGSPTKRRTATAARTGSGSPQCYHHYEPERRANCTQLIFPLYAAGRATTRLRTRRWIIGCLHHIGDQFYLRSAKSAAQLLEEGGNVDPWDVYALVGGYAFNG